jgi:hypothetical protein
MNEILESFTLDFTPANRTAGEMFSTILLVSDDASIDLSDQARAMSTQYFLIEQAKERGNFGEGNMNMWYKVGVTQAVSLSLFVKDVQEQQGKTNYVPWIIVGASVLAVVVLGLVARKCIKKKDTVDEMQVSLNN